MAGLGQPGSGVLAIDPDRVIEAAGALDELVAMHRDDSAIWDSASCDTGDADMTAAVSLFVTSWGAGLNYLLTEQACRAEALRKAVETLVGHDVDTAYALRTIVEPR